MSDLTFAIVTCSDTRTIETDEAGAALRDDIEQAGWSVASHEIVADDRAAISGAIVHAADQLGVDVVLTCGGTGFSPRDVTPEATLDVADRIAPGIAEAIRAGSLAITRRAMLSRATSALRGSSIIVNLPGSRKAARESFGFFSDQLEHAVEMLAGGGH